MADSQQSETPAVPRPPFAVADVPLEEWPAERLAALPRGISRHVVRFVRLGGQVTVGVRPEDLDIAEHGLAVQVDVVEELGADAYVYGTLRGQGSDLPIIARTDGRRPPEKGATIHLAPKQDHVHLFDVGTGQRLGV